MKPIRKWPRVLGRRELHEVRDHLEDTLEALGFTLYSQGGEKGSCHLQMHFPDGPLLICFELHPQGYQVGLHVPEPQRSGGRTLH